MAERRRRDGLSLMDQVAERLRARLEDPRYLAHELIREQLGDPSPFLGDGRPECPWIVFDRAENLYAFYLRGRELVQKVSGRPDTVVCALSMRERSKGHG